MKAIVDQETCIGCGLCVQVCEQAFKMDGDKAVAVSSQVADNAKECAKQAANDCPVTAIKIEG